MIRKSKREIEAALARLRDDPGDDPGDWFDVETEVVTVAGIDEDGTLLDEDGEPVTPDHPDTPGWFSVPSPADAEDAP